MDITAIRQALSDAFQDAWPTWHCYPFLVDSFGTPALMVMSPEVLYDEDMSGLTKLNINIRYATGRANEVEAQMLLCTVLSTGVGSAKLVIDEIRDFPIKLLRARNVGNFRLSSGEIYIGAEQELEILAT
jgi:hypothetical protein